MTGVRSVLAVVVAAVIVGFGSGVAVAADSVAITVKRDGLRLVADRPAKYTITVRNRGEEPVPLTIRASLPPWMTEVAGGDDAEVGDGFVDWPVTVDPGGTAKLQLTGTYTRAGIEQRTGPVQAAFTACAFDQEEDQPIACATDVAELDASMAPLWWLIAGIAAVLVAAFGVGRTLWRRRRSRLPATAPAEQPALP